MTYIDIFLFSKKRTLVFHPLPPSYVLYARENVENYGPPLTELSRAQPLNRCHMGHVENLTSGNSLCYGRSYVMLW